LLRRGDPHTKGGAGERDGSQEVGPGEDDDLTAPCPSQHPGDLVGAVGLGHVLARMQCRLIRR